MYDLEKSWRKGLTAAAVLAAGLAVSLTVVPANGDELQSSIARGGRIYDNWYGEIGATKPETTHPAWPAANAEKSGATTWRCKSCHGWDLMGKDGAYASGSYLTGIGGLTAFAGGSNDAVIAAVKDATHGFADLMREQDFVDLANFVTQGQFDIDGVISRETKLVTSDVGMGGAYYNTVCATCHGIDGKLPKELEKTLGALANENPWEIIQKIQNGQPDEQMPAMRAFGVPVSAEILAYLQTLPLE